MDEAVPAQGGIPMNNIPMARVDVSKRFSDLCVLTPENEVFARTKIYNAGYEVIVVNPIQSGALKNINVRKVKNDKVDAHKIALLYRLKVLHPSQVPADSLRGLRLLCRQRSEVMKEYYTFQKSPDSFAGSNLSWL